MIRLWYGRIRTNPNTEDVMYLVALPIEPMPVGSEYPDGEPLPMHCTLMHWFTLGHKDKEEYVVAFIEALACGVGAQGIELVSERRALFGSNKDVPVVVLKPNALLNEMHTELLLSLASRRSGSGHTSWIGAGYCAHVADAHGWSFNLGSVHVATELVLVRRDDEKVKRIVKSFPFNARHPSSDW